MFRFSDFLRQFEDKEEFSLDDLDSDILKKFYQGWLNLKPEDGLLPKAGIDLQKFEGILGYIALTRIEKVPFRVRYDIVGSNLVSLYGKDVTGKYINDLYGKQEREHALRGYQWVMAHGKPLYSQCTYKTPFRKLGYRKVIVPLKDEEDGRGQALSCIVPLDMNMKVADQWRKLDDVQYWQNVIRK